MCRRSTLKMCMFVQKGTVEQRTKWDKQNCSETGNRPQVRTALNPSTSLASMRIDVSNKTEPTYDSSSCESETKFNTIIYVALTVILSLLTLLIWSAAIIGLRKGENTQLSCFSVDSLVELVSASKRRLSLAKTSATPPTSTVDSSYYKNLPRTPLRLTFLDHLPEPPKITVDKLKELNIAFNTAPRILNEEEKEPDLNSSRSTLDIPLAK
ncbi:hypothetical protein L596_005899 [Steinernema carpocapsae]|uniref:Uncharacterized protein n=1 Tax=Steinernema carpocapsae TaxID=34508 RepID=A0A4U8V0Q8_STECR|nr:hypothetical protein L596_005899 [Steinernema carpocapsae]